MKITLSEEIYDAIIAAIIQGEIHSDSVVTEALLMERFHVSKSPVRESLVRLCHENILVSIPRVGYRIQSVDREYLEGIIRFRLNLEPRYLELFFDKISETDIVRIRKSIVPMDKTVLNNPFEYWKQTSHFHLALAISYLDKFYYDILKKILDRQLITFATLYWSNWSDTADKKMSDNHTAVLNAIERHEKRAAIYLLEEDIKSA